MTEAKDHPHAVARDAFIEINGVTQPVSYPHTHTQRERERERECVSHYSVKMDTK